MADDQREPIRSINLWYWREDIDMIGVCARTHTLVDRRWIYSNGDSHWPVCHFVSTFHCFLFPIHPNRSKQLTALQSQARLQVSPTGESHSGGISLFLLWLCKALWDASGYDLAPFNKSWLIVCDWLIDWKTERKRRKAKKKERKSKYNGVFASSFLGGRGCCSVLLFLVCWSVHVCACACLIKRLMTYRVSSFHSHLHVGSFSCFECIWNPLTIKGL